MSIIIIQLLSGSPEEKLKSRMEIQIKCITRNKMIVIAYFNYDSQCSDIEKFADNDTAYQWLYDRWGWIVKDETPTPTTLRELIILLINDCDVMVEMIEI